MRAFLNLATAALARALGSVFDYTHLTARRQYAGIAVALALVAVMLVVVSLSIAGYAVGRAISTIGEAQIGQWAAKLSENLSEPRYQTDIEKIAAGQIPSPQAVAELTAGHRSGQIISFVLRTMDGRRIMSVDDAQLLGKVSEDVPQTTTETRPAAGILALPASFPPGFYVQANVYLTVGDRTIAQVHAVVDQSANYKASNAIATMATLLIMGLFLLTVIAATITVYRGRERQRRAESRIHYLAHHDVLTGLVNRAQFMGNLATAVSKALTDGKGLAVLFVDLDHFKSVNDTLGHDGGDYLLRAVADRLQSMVRDGDTVARFGGDEFVLILPQMGDAEAVEVFAERLNAKLREPIHYNGQDIVATISVGVALGLKDGADADRLIKSADLAVYKSKADGRNCVRFFTPSMDAELQTRIELEHRIRQALLNDGFQLHYQPIFDMHTRQLMGFEALVRLVREDGSLIPPMEFIPVAEEIRVIDKIGRWVLDEACKTAATWPDHLTIAVNLSPAQFLSGSISEIVAAALHETGLAANRLELEITETLLLNDTSVIMEEMQKLKDMGVSIAMDDFGTGYSSLSYLWRFPFDKIKIDRSFMQAFDGTNHDAQTVVKTVIALGRELNMRVTP